MFDDLPPDRERLHALRVWHALWLGRIDRKIAAVRKQQAGREQGERARPDPPLRLPGWGPDTPPTAPALHDRMWGRATAVCLRPGRALVLVGSPIQLSPVPRGTRPAGDCVWSPG